MGGPEPVSVEKLWDELWVGVKCQSNPEIAGTPRNSFRLASGSTEGGRALIGLGALQGYRTHSNSEFRQMRAWESDSEG